MEARRKRRTDAHRRADVALRHVQLVCAKAGYVTTVPESGADYGIDLVLDTFDEDGYIENGDVGIQVKGVGRVVQSADGRWLPFAVDRRDLDCWLAEDEPIILVVYDAAADVAYWVHMQAYFAHRPAFSLQGVGRQVTIRVAVADVFDPAAVRTIRGLKNAVRRHRPERGMT